MRHFSDISKSVCHISSLTQKWNGVQSTFPQESLGEKISKIGSNLQMKHHF